LYDPSISHVKIITRYVLKEHIGPFVFALSALTSLLLLQYIARRFGDLVGRGLSWQVITEFFLLSIPFTLAMTLPMSVLVAVLYAFSRLASENEITALKAGGVSSRALMIPAVIAAVFLAVFMTYFNDQLLPRANHQLATLQMAILRTKPTFALKPQVINTIKEGQLYLRAGQIDEASGLMQDVTIYDLTDARRRRTIYADSGTLTLAQNRRDLSMHLFKGLMLTAPDERPGQITRIYYGEDVLKVRDVANQFQTISADTSMKGDREMSVCEMQRGTRLGAARAVRQRPRGVARGPGKNRENDGDAGPRFVENESRRHRRFVLRDGEAVSQQELLRRERSAGGRAAAAAATAAATAAARHHETTAARHHETSAARNDRRRRQRAERHGPERLHPRRRIRSLRETDRQARHSEGDHR
jgi:hypothetical protein